MRISKRTMSMILALVLALSVTAFGTVAYMTDRDSVTNTFTVGNISIIVDEENEYFCDIDGVLYNKDKTEIILYPMNHPQYLREKYGYNDTIWADGENNMEFRARYEADILTYLWCSQTHTTRLAKSNPHIIDQLLEVGIRSVDILATLTQYGRAIYNYRKNHNKIP